MKTNSLLSIAIALAVGTSITKADTIAYYRFEDIITVPNTVVPAADGDGITGNEGNDPTNNTYSPSYSDAGVPSATDNNRMRTWNAGETFATSSNVASATVPKNGLANTRSASFGAFPDSIFTNDSGTQGSLGAGTYHSLTAEAYVRIENPTDGWVRTVFTIDDWGDSNRNPEPMPEPTIGMRFEIFNSGTVRLGAFANSATGPSSTGVPLFISSDNLDLISGEWIHVALTIDAPTNTMKLFLNGAEVASSDQLTGGYLGNPNHNQVVLARGFYNGVDNASALNGHLDEVRFSDVALKPSQFLNSSSSNPAAPTISNVTLNTGTSMLELTITNIPSNQTFHITSSETLEVFSPLGSACDFDSNTTQPISIPVTPSPTVPKMFFRAETGASPVPPQ